MTSFSQSFISFSLAEMEKRGGDIRRWVNDSSAVVSEVCRAIIEAAARGATEK